MGAEGAQTQGGWLSTWKTPDSGKRELHPLRLRLLWEPWGRRGLSVGLPVVLRAGVGSGLGKWELATWGHPERMTSAVHVPSLVIMRCWMLPIKSILVRTSWVCLCDINTLPLPTHWAPLTPTTPAPRPGTPQSGALDLHRGWNEYLPQPLDSLSPPHPTFSDSLVRASRQFAGSHSQPPAYSVPFRSPQAGLRTKRFYPWPGLQASDL